MVEGRFLSMKAHARELGVGQPDRILATGGGSNNAEVGECVIPCLVKAVLFIFRLGCPREIAHRNGDTVCTNDLPCSAAVACFRFHRCCVGLS